jgi:hypothetical protein
MRAAALLLAVAPAAAFVAAGYGAMALVGFEQAEIRIIEVVFRWLAFYILGKRVLVGLTRREASGRPAAIDASPETVRLLTATYGRAGSMLVFVMIADRLSSEWLGTGSVRVLVWGLGLIWLGGWALWVIFAWRRKVGETLTRLSAEGSVVHRLGMWVAGHLAGVLLVLPLVLIVVILAAGRWLKGLLADGGLLAYLRARALRRLSRRTRQSPDGRPPRTLPERYTRQFPLYPLQGEEGEVILPREKLVASVADQIRHWRETGEDSSVVLAGEKGIGKTTMIALLERQLTEPEVLRHTLARKLRSEKALVDNLAPMLGAEGAANLGALAAHLNGGDRRVVLLDEAHNVFLRTVGGFQAFEALARLVSFTSQKVFWVLVFNSFAWDFLSRSLTRAHGFRRVVTIPSWTREEIQELIVKRNRETGFSLVFDDVLLDEDRSATGQLELLEGAEGFFRLLWEASRGNSRVATYLWLQALTPVDDATVRVGLFAEGPVARLQGLESEMVFALAAICQHENLSFDELREALNVPLDHAGFAMRFLLEYGVLEPKHTDDRRLTLAPQHYRQVLQLLRDRHLLLGEG